MKSEKRSIVSPARFQQLQQPNVVYTITCGRDGCYSETGGCFCDTGDEYCQRGFFSLFIQVVYGIDFSLRMNLPYRVDFGNIRYCYSDETLADRNFWNYFFKQPVPAMNRALTPVANRFIELFPMRIWDRKHFREMHEKVVSNLCFTDHVAEHLKHAKSKFTTQRVLGIQIRKTDHSAEIPPVSADKVNYTIEKHIRYYDALFVATDDANVVEEFKCKYPSKVFFNEVTRSVDKQPVHRAVTGGNRIALGLDVLTDCYCLSLCDKVIVGHSNISYAALLFNPELDYILLERMQSKIKRLRTLLVYHLNRLGIRKW